MGYSPEHTAATRARILESAGRLFRRHGYQAAAIDDIMAGAGLTRGGFYAHFRSKEDLFVEVLREGLEFTEQLRQAAARRPEASAASAFEAVRYYLDPSNTHRIARGCTVVATSADIARAPRRARAAFTGVLEPLLAEFEHLVAGGVADRRGRGLAALATCVGAVSMAQTLTDPLLAEELLEACRTRVARDLGHEANATNSAPREATTTRSQRRSHS